MLTRAVKVSSFGGLISAGLIAKNRQDGLLQSKEKPSMVPSTAVEHNKPLDDEKIKLNFNDKIKELNPNKVEHTTAMNKHSTKVSELVLSQVELVTPTDQEWKRRAKEANIKAEDLCWCEMNESGCSGMALAISVNGKLVFHRGFCYSDLENQIFTKSSTIMKVAGVSNPPVMMVLAKLWQEGRVDLDSKMSRYVPNWQNVMEKDKEEDMTVRQLASWFLGGDRHDTNKERVEEANSDQSQSRHVLTLLTQVVENIVGQPYQKYMETQFSTLGLQNTYIDQARPLIYNRSRHYTRDENHRMKNVPSDTGPGAGVLSNAVDLVNLGNGFLHSYQTKGTEETCQQPRHRSSDCAPHPSDHAPHPSDHAPHHRDRAPHPSDQVPGYLDRSTISEILQNTKLMTPDRDEDHKLGWSLRPRYGYGFHPNHQPYLTYTGESVGATSALLVAPGTPGEGGEVAPTVPRGVVVALLCNMQGIGLAKLAVNIASAYQELEEEKPVSLHTVYQC